MSTLTHLDEKGRARMVDVSEKGETLRVAVAQGEVLLDPETFARVLEGDVKKGDVLAAARIAGIMAAKKTPELIPLCHPVRLSNVRVEFLPDEARSSIKIEAEARALDKTGVEMEALVAVGVAALTIYDMVKSLKRDAVITGIRLMRKSGGKSGDYTFKG